MSTISLRLDDREDELIRRYAAIHNVSVSELIRKAVIDQIESEIDVEIFDKAVAESKATYSLDRVKEELGLK
ncbi:MAG: CopG family transcriptional regulator [Firmicutes bacterium HGW-Firmicutes-7]|nr:MAG: CopG family transcriptional regulator [Firmicutes bacterium HGW-Firmicutes-7]